MTYTEFLKNKSVSAPKSGFDISPSAINPTLFDWQKAIVRWAAAKGKAAIFADCGLGKTFMQLEWARLVCEHTGGGALILAPLAVSRQTKREGDKIGVDVNICRDAADIRPGVNITNYERLDRFEPFADGDFAGVVLDESSILKSFTGRTKQAIIERFARTPYKLACTATPSPNDFMELGNHAEFLDVSTRGRMLAEYFIHDGGDTLKWRLKGHAERDFWRWVASWAIMLKKPSDLGFDDAGYDLPALDIRGHVLECAPDVGELVVMPARTLLERRAARKSGMGGRVALAADIANGLNGQCLAWCDLNDESKALSKAIVGAVEVTGSDEPEKKEAAMIGFAEGNVRCLVTKPRIAGFGMNWQNCSDMIFCGLSDSYEQFYQALRRCWRFGQERPVTARVIISERETAVLDNIRRKEADAERMARAMVEVTAEIIKKELGRVTRERTAYNPGRAMAVPAWIGV